MKRSKRCPKCQGTDLLHVPTFMEAGDMGRTPMAVTEAETGEMFGIPMMTPVGEFEVVICRHCGYAEFYVKNAGDIPADGTNVKYLE